MKTKVAVVGSGNIGSDLLVKLQRSTVLQPVLLVGVDPTSDGLHRASEMGIDVTAGGVDDLLRDTHGASIVFEATSAQAHLANAPRYAAAGLTALDLTPAAVGPFVVPAVNLAEVRQAPNLNLVTCGGQATVPVVAAIASVTTVSYAEIVSSLASRAAGPGTRANIDEFVNTTSRALVDVGGARAGKAIIILNPADPPIRMRNTVLCAVPPDANHEAITWAVHDYVQAVQRYAPGYRLKAGPVFEPEQGPGGTTVVQVFLEVTGAADYLPSYAGNLDIITAAAVETAEQLVRESAGAAA